MRLLTNNPDKIYQLSDFGLEIVERSGPIQIPATAEDLAYLKTKQQRIGASGPVLMAPCFKKSKRIRKGGIQNMKYYEGNLVAEGARIGVV